VKNPLENQHFASYNRFVTKAMLKNIMTGSTNGSYVNSHHCMLNKKKKGIKLPNYQTPGISHNALYIRIKRMFSIDLAKKE